MSLGGRGVASVCPRGARALLPIPATCLTPSFHCISLKIVRVHTLQSGTLKMLVGFILQRAHSGETPGSTSLVSFPVLAAGGGGRSVALKVNPPLLIRLGKAVS